MQKHNLYECSSGERCNMEGSFFFIFLEVTRNIKTVGVKNIGGWGSLKLPLVGVKNIGGWRSLKFQGPMRSCDLTIDRWLVLFDKKCFHDLETERVIVCMYDFCIVNQVSLVSLVP